MLPDNLLESLENPQELPAACNKGDEATIEPIQVKVDNARIPLEL